MDQLNYTETLNILWHKLMKLNENKYMDQKYKRLKELSTVEIGIINVVSLKPDIIFREICEEFDLPKSTLTNIIDRLENHGYLKRTISQIDRRSYGLKLTEEGILVEKEHIDYENEMLSGLFNALDTEEEKRMFLNLVEKIVKKLER